MNIVDIIIIILLGLGAFLGFMRGFFRELVSAVGVIVAAVLAFLLKNPVSEFMYSNLPFFKFGSLLKGAPVLNILLYEVIAFLIMFSIFMIIIQIIKMVTKLVELVLKITVILGVPSMILGAVVGLIESFVLIFVGLYVLSLPVFNIDIVNESKLKSTILNSTPILSNFVDESTKIINEFNDLKDKYKDSTNDEFNNEAMDLMLKYDIITPSSAENLLEKGKIDIDKNIIDKYKNKEE